MAIYEICGFGQWLHEKLSEFGCKHILVVQPDTSTVQKTDRRDANHLGEILWNNRRRIIQNLPINGIREIALSTQEMNDIRKLTNTADLSPEKYLLQQVHHLANQKRWV